MKIFKKEYDRNYVLYGGLIITFAILYLATAFVSFYHAITFFNIANAIWLSVILSFVAEIGQASVLFSILLTDNKNKFLPWAIMIILTSLQVIGNVVSSFDWIIAHNDAGLDGFKRSILFAVQTDDPEMFRIIVAWISGALLPVIALSMTALVAQNMDLRAKEKNTQLSGSTTGSMTGSTIPLDVKIDEQLLESTTPLNITVEDNQIVDAKDIISEISKIRPTEEELSTLENLLSTKKPIIDVPKEDDVNMENNEEPVQSLSEEEVTKMNLDEHEKIFDEPEESIEPDDEDIFGPVDLTNEIPDIILTEPEFVSEETISPSPLVEEKKIDETPPLIGLEKKPNETPEIKKTDVVNVPPPNDNLSSEQLERIRQIARERQLKKK